MGVIHIHSQHLAKVLQRLGDLDESTLLNEAFAVAISNGALWERDFIRHHDASYNPRPARVTLILINDGGRKEPEELAAGMLASLGRELIDLANDETRLPSSIWQLAHDAVKLMEPLPSSKIDAASVTQPILGVALANLLDRARHIHQAHLTRQEEVSLALQDRLRFLLPLAQSDYPRLCSLLNSWEGRMQRKHPPSNQA